ncbi:Ada metal-binding domain-containing protein [Sphingobacterium faecale]|uniref:Metal-binding protein n=1 Tax=Sphingobacterium faecale TaxID=2803775 RepID=A0ABS1R390_9SPHI|nr:Ada metal-binding domain-containing protein [Sphingobacterium faecale]MBL1409019.1 metal-binding protein [Sphingobacterium faecale]
MIRHHEIADRELRAKIRKGKVCWAGNNKLKIYGTLSCASGKRMKRKNRVFFASEQEALSANYRPCGHCMNHKYKKWLYASK